MLMLLLTVRKSKLDELLSTRHSDLRKFTNVTLTVLAASARWADISRSGERTNGGTPQRYSMEFKKSR
jgi:hypothetical protein